MRILLVTHYYRPEIGAPQRRWDALVQRFIDAGHEVAVLTPAPHYPGGRLTSQAPAVQPGAIARGEHGELVHRLPFREYGRGIGGRGTDQLRAAGAAVTTGLARFAGLHRPHVVVASVPGLPTLPAGLVLGAGLRAPVVVEMRDAWPDLLGTRGDWAGPGDSTAVESRLARWTTAALSGAITTMQRRAAAVVTTTDAFAEVMTGRGLGRVTTVRHGTTVQQAPARRQPEGRPLRVLYAGTVGRSQGLESAVEALARCRSRGVPVDLRIVGDGAQLAPLRALADALGVPVSFEPTVPSDEVADHYAWADSILVPLRSWEPLRWTVPSKLYDALATGRHVSAAVSGEAADIVTRTRGGHVVPPEDPGALADLWQLLSTAPAQLDVGDEARAWVRAHADDDALAHRYLSLLREAVNG